jgi:6-phosphogluconolactonase
MQNSILLLLLLLSQYVHAQHYYLFLGSYTYEHSGSKGLYVYTFDAATGKLAFVSHADTTIVNPTYMAIAPDGRHLYVTTDAKMPYPGSITAFSFDDKTGKLTLVNKQSSRGENPAYVDVNQKKTWVVTAHYTAGSVAILPLKPDGSLGETRQVFPHKGRVGENGKEVPHVHLAMFSPDQKAVLVTDCARDKLVIYPFREATEQPLSPPIEYPTRAGGFVRHVTFHPSLPVLYAVHEKGGIVSAFRYIEGQLDSLQVIAAHDSSFHGPFFSSDLHISPDGRFLYAANRGTENNLAIFSIHPKTGKLKLVGIQSTFGKTPRNFAIEPSGKYVLVGNQDSGTVVVFQRNENTGLLSPTGETITIPQVSCLKFLKQGK